MAKLKGKEFEIDAKRYTFIEHLDNGGSSNIWIAETENKKYAIKILEAEDNKKIERFKKEIEFCENTKHDNLITVYSHGEINNKLCYVMELYESNFSELIKNGISLEKGFDYIFQICSALEFLHNNNVIHRDLKPKNILVEKDKMVLADLGIAHFENSSITSKDDLLANRGYAAPEQKIKGLSKNITTAVDIFSLGLIINEIFTRKKPEGSNFTLISDLYPWLIDVDGLVERCIRQNPAERPNIKEVSLELKLKFEELKDEITLIKENLKEHFEEIDSSKDCDSEIKEKIIEQASKDILTAKYFFENKTAEELEKYNHNYNCNIHYKLDSVLRREYMKYLLKKRCKRTFLYESNVYKDGNYNYVPLNLNDNPEDRKLYKKFYDFLTDNFIVDGELLKLFSSCCNYHCEEIIQDLDKIQKEVENLDDAPILYIVMHIINIKDNNDILLEDQILVNWKETIANYGINSTYMELFKEDNCEEEIKILNEFIKNYSAVFTKKDNGFLIRFEDRKLYKEFKQYVIELSETNCAFKENVLDLVRVEKEYDGIIELKLWNSIDIKNTLAKIVGFRKDY
ncbi:serine/threonine-protein kinase [Oribacterium sp.]